MEQFKHQARLGVIRQQTVGKSFSQIGAVMKSVRSVYLFLSSLVLIALWDTRLFHQVLYSILKDKPVFFYRGQLAKFWLDMPNHELNLPVSIYSVAQGVLLALVSFYLLRMLSEALDSKFSVVERLNALSAYVITMFFALLASSLGFFVLRLKLSGITIKPLTAGAVGMTEYLSGLGFIPWIGIMIVFGLVAVIPGEQIKRIAPARRSDRSNGELKPEYQLAA